MVLGLSKSSKSSKSTAVDEKKKEQQQQSSSNGTSSSSADILKTPLDAPTPTSKPAPRPTLTEAQTAKYEWLLAQANSWTSIASTSAEAPAGPLTDDERLWLSRECLLRYLRATKWHEKEAAKRVLDTLVWRRDYGVDRLTADYISPENETGKQMVLGFDKEARVCHYLNPGRQNTDASPRQVQHLVYMLERVIDVMPAGQEMLALLINFKAGKGGRSNTAPGIGLGREVLHILQTHYPERLGRALIINVPVIVWGFFKLITPFIDPLTREKLKFNEDMNQYVPSEQLWTEFSGKLEFEYDHAVYWPALTKMAHDHREARKARWIAGGKHIGESEDYLAGGLEYGIAGAPTSTEAPVAADAAAAAAAAAPSLPVTEAAESSDGATVAETTNNVEEKLADLKVADSVETPVANGKAVAA